MWLLSYKYFVHFSIWTKCLSDGIKNANTRTAHKFLTNFSNDTDVSKQKFISQLVIQDETDACPTNSWNMTSSDFVYLPFPFLSVHLFLVVAYSKKAGRILPINTSNDAFSVLGWKKLNLIFNWFIRKNLKKIQWRQTVENLKNSSNCHNSGCTQHRVNNFWFYGMVFRIGQFNGVI